MCVSRKSNPAVPCRCFLVTQGAQGGTGPTQAATTTRDGTGGQEGPTSKSSFVFFSYFSTLLFSSSRFFSVYLFSPGNSNAGRHGGGGGAGGPDGDNICHFLIFLLSSVFFLIFYFSECLCFLWSATTDGAGQDGTYQRGR